jgi:hypothetical protein
MVFSEGAAKGQLVVAWMNVMRLQDVLVPSVVGRLSCDGWKRLNGGTRQLLSQPMTSEQATPAWCCWPRVGRATHRCCRDVTGPWWFQRRPYGRRKDMSADRARGEAGPPRCDGTAERDGAVVKRKAGPGRIVSQASGTTSQTRRGV